MHITAVISHSSAYPDPIQFAPGDRLQLGKRDTEYVGWIWVTTPSGKEGWAPDTYLRQFSDTAGVALLHYTAKELNTVAGDHLIRHKELNDWL